MLRGQGPGARRSPLGWGGGGDGVEESERGGLTWYIPSVPRFQALCGMVHSSVAL